MLDLILKAVDESGLPAEYKLDEKAKFTKLHETNGLIEFVNTFMLADKTAQEESRFKAAKEKLQIYYQILDAITRALTEKTGMSPQAAFEKIKQIDGEVMDGKVTVDNVLAWAASL